MHTLLNQYMGAQNQLVRCNMYNLNILLLALQKVLNAPEIVNTLSAYCITSSLHKSTTYRTGLPLTKFHLPQPKHHLRMFFHHQGLLLPDSYAINLYCYMKSIFITVLAYTSVEKQFGILIVMIE